jgi:hypothetical protein
MPEHSIQVPAGAPRCDAFDYTDFPDEGAGSPALCAHHTEQLKKHGVTFGRGGFKMEPTHGKSAVYQIAAKGASTRYRGSPDGIITRYHIASESATSAAFVIYEHKQSADAKMAYRSKHPELLNLTEVCSATAKRCVRTAPCTVRTQCIRTAR